MRAPWFSLASRRAAVWARERVVRRTATGEARRASATARGGSSAEEGRRGIVRREASIPRAWAWRRSSRAYASMGGSATTRGDSPGWWPRQRFRRTWTARGFISRRYYSLYFIL